MTQGLQSAQMTSHIVLRHCQLKELRGIIKRQRKKDRLIKNAS
jgi:hypothetical protein